MLEPASALVRNSMMFFSRNARFEQCSMKQNVCRSIWWICKSSTIMYCVIKLLLSFFVIALKLLFCSVSIALVSYDCHISSFFLRQPGAFSCASFRLPIFLKTIVVGSMKYLKSKYVQLVKTVIIPLFFIESLQILTGV